ncbi:MAG: hypothetical protein HYX27_00340 [Acidobacteria bacterium]|nr:hypothetical protein [Acidobacteriota bacterium]
MFRSFFLILALTAAAADWNSARFPDWSQDTVLRLLTSSPWAKGSGADIEWTKRELRPITYKDIPGADHNQVKDPGLGPLGGIGAPKPKLPTKADLLIRFPNALPLRHAKALYRLRDEKLPADRLNGLIDAPAPDYVVEIFGVPSEVAHQGAGTVEALVMRSAWLRTRAGRTYKPSKVDVFIQPTTLKILVHFPSEEPLRVRDEEIEFFADIQLLKCKEKFKLSSMIYLGRLEL